jgi:hypothetical protein
LASPTSSFLALVTTRVPKVHFASFMSLCPFTMCVHLSQSPQSYASLGLCKEELHNKIRSTHVRLVRRLSSSARIYERAISLSLMYSSSYSHRIHKNGEILLRMILFANNNRPTWWTAYMLTLWGNLTKPLPAGMRLTRNAVIMDAMWTNAAILIHRGIGGRPRPLMDLGRHQFDE